MTSYPRAWQGLADVTCQTHKAWADTHGYDYYADCSDLVDSYYNPHSRTTERLPIKGFIKTTLFLHYLPQYKTVIWLDNDLAVTNTSISADGLWRMAPVTAGTGVVMGFDYNGINSTVIIAQSTDLVYDYMWALENTGRKLFLSHDWVEMMAARFFEMTPPYDKLVALASIADLCPMHPGAYLPYVPDRVTEKYWWKPGAFAIHLSALPLERRIELAREYVEKMNARIS